MFNFVKICSFIIYLKLGGGTMKTAPFVVC
jgi:hypothetical protein